MDNATIDLQHQFYDMLMQSQYWSPERMRDYQRSQLTHLLRHAKKNVPFYENRLDAVLKSNGDIDWDRWGEIPIVKRSDLTEHREAMQAKELPPGHGPVGAIQSSGSTGEPVTVLVTRLARLGSEVARWRSSSWHDLDFAQDLCIRHGDDEETRPPTGRQEGVWGPPWNAVATGRTYRMTRGWSVEDQLAFVARVQSPYLAIGNPKVAYSIAQEAVRTKTIVRLSHIFASGEKAGSEERKICREVFGAEIIELYSSKEGGHIAHTCAKRNGFHVNAERIFVELLDNNGAQVPNGTQGRVIITPFFSTAQPLIRYDQGDLATWGKSCGCGNNLPYLGSIDGRQSQMFRHPDGRRIHRGIPEEFRDRLDASMWQFAQVGPTTFEIRYVPRNQDKTGDEAATAEAFRRFYFEDAHITFHRVASIPLTKSGKFMEFVYEEPVSHPAT